MKHMRLGLVDDVAAELARALRPRCRECRTRPAYRRRGLCSRCYSSAEVRTRYSAGSKPTYKPLERGSRLPPSEPTSALPGSEEKVLVLQARAALGLSLWHPLDATRHGERKGD